MKTFKDTVIATAKAMVTSDNSSKVLFNDTIGLLKGAKVTDVKSSVRGLTDDAKEALANDFSSNFVNRIVKTITLAGQWYDKKLFTKHEELFMYNIEGGLKLLNALEEIESEDVVKSCKNKLNRVKFVDKIQYNNDFEVKVKELMKEYNLADVDGKILKMEQSITKLWADMTQEQQVDFLQYITNNCKVKPSNVEDNKDEVVA